MGREVVEYNVDLQGSGHAGVDALEELQNVRGGMTASAMGEDLAAADVEGGEEIGRAMTLVVMS